MRQFHIHKWDRTKLKTSEKKNNNVPNKEASHFYTIHKVQKRKRIHTISLLKENE